MSSARKLLISITLTLMLALCALTLMAALSGIARAKSAKSRTYNIKLYNGGEVVEEWHGISKYTRWSDQYVTFLLDGEEVKVIGGTLVIREEELLSENDG